MGSCAFWSERIFNDLADGYSEVGDEVSSRGWLDPERIETLHPTCVFSPPFVVFMGLIVKDLSILKVSYFVTHIDSLVEVRLIP